MVDIQAILQRAYDYGITYIDKGVVANYIPELAKEDKTRGGGCHYRYGRFRVYSRGCTVSIQHSKYCKDYYLSLRVGTL